VHRPVGPFGLSAAIARNAHQIVARTAPGRLSRPAPYRLIITKPANLSPANGIASTPAQTRSSLGWARPPLTSGMVLFIVASCPERR
jgi:hypothetical protein